MKTLNFKQAFHRTFVEGDATNYQMMIAFLPIALPALIAVVWFCITHHLSF